MAAYFRLQDVIEVTGTRTQDRADVLDIGAYRHFSFQVRVFNLASTAGTLYLQTSAVNEESGWLDIPNLSVSLTSAGDANKLLVATDVLRFVRWRVNGVNVSSRFLIDLVAR